MVKRELSSTLKNLKFMQRAAQKEEKSKKEEELQPNSDFVSPGFQNRKCIVIMEGDPHPGALKGRMSFQSFNPSIDKVNEEAASLCQPKAFATNSVNQNGGAYPRENESSATMTESSNVARPDSDCDGDHKRKQPYIKTESQYPGESQRNIISLGDQRPSPRNSKASYKKQKHEKLDWSVLRPPKAQNKRG
ncbi:PREDICTED: uncharacterized protein LOC104597166 [Nelumbo nucifera]|uniref:M-phase phosphoprotein 6 n=2 Tax=Nelumbo nucifera TaxID=4432 RepID=A0A822Y4C1_NELNU|nr:PREDICTED: uncharacterized protein LOC104597166 [Nelumbo nucifera]DAD26451.1 TPA_asm: hypothetical protein HUJ06_027919 [Nelumbo nucifera]